MEHDINSLPPWELLLKRILWTQIGRLHDKRILDFGSGICVNANYYAAENDGVAEEPSRESVLKRWDGHANRQIVGSTD